MARAFGIVTAKNGGITGITINSLNKTETTKEASVIGEDGKTLEIKAYSIEKTIDVSGVIDGAAPAAGNKLTIGGVDYLISSVKVNEASEAFVTVDLSAKTTDNATITTLTTGA